MQIFGIFFFFTFPSRDSTGCKIMEISLHLPQTSWVIISQGNCPQAWEGTHKSASRALAGSPEAPCMWTTLGGWVRGGRLFHGSLDAALDWPHSPCRRRWWTTLWGPFPTSQTSGTLSCWWPAGACHAPTPRRTWKPPTHPRMEKGSTRWFATSSSLRT